MIETDRLIIRPWRVEEADRFFDRYRRLDVVQWLAAPPMQDRREAVDIIERGIAGEAAMAFDHDFAKVWAVTLLADHRSVGVCRRVGMRLLGVTRRWYEHPSLMFWIGTTGASAC